MDKLKRIGLLFVLILLGLLYVFFYWNTWLFDRANRIEDRQSKIHLLEGSINFCPLNDEVFYELGKAYFDLGVGALTNPASGERFFRKSVQNFERSLRINPTSPFAHFYLGQSLLHLGLFTAQKNERFYSELKKAALLAGEDSQILIETGRLFFSHWPKLSEADRRFTIGLVRRIMDRKDAAEISRFMNIWELSVGDYGVMDEILPANSSIYRAYARFLGEKSLSLAERQKYLARAEGMDFVQARREQQLGEAALFANRLGEATVHFQSALGLLRGIRFYQGLSGLDLIQAEGYRELVKSVCLSLVRCRVEEGTALKNMEAEIRRYIALEEEPKEIGALEALLRNRGLLPNSAADFSADLDRLALELLLEFKQKRYGEIIDLGRRLGRSVLMVPEEKKGAFIRILRIVGDAYQKTDYLYDAGDFYSRALELNPEDLETLLRIRRNYERLNEGQKLRETDRAIEKVITPQDIESSSRPIPKGGTFTRVLTLDLEEITLDLALAIDDRADPLVTIIFNDRVVWEEYMSEPSLSLRLRTDIGENTLQILAPARPLLITKVGWRRGGENNNIRISRSMK